jgi:PST family polysaccharide transporter
MVHIKEKTNALIIGAFVGFQELAFYDFAIKIIDVLKLPFTIFRDAIFPQVMQMKSIYVVKKIINYSVLISLLFYLFVVLFGKHLVLLLGKEELLGAEKLFYLMGLYFPLTCLALYSGMGLIALSLKKLFSRSILISIIIYGVLLFFYLSFFSNTNIYILISIYLLSLFIESFMRYFYLIKYRE